MTSNAGSIKSQVIRERHSMEPFYQIMLLILYMYMYLPILISTQSRRQNA